jgi:hypothetical protein
MTTTASTYYNNIDVNFPIAGQDNSSQGFRDNFNNIALALTDIDTRLVSTETTNIGATYLISSPPLSSHGAMGDKAGMVYASSTTVCICYNDYVDDNTDIWVQLSTLPSPW